MRLSVITTIIIIIITLASSSSSSSSSSHSYYSKKNKKIRKNHHEDNGALLRSSSIFENEAKTTFGHQVWRCRGGSELLREVRDGSHSVWRDRERGEIDVRVSPEQQSHFSGLLRSGHCETKISDLDSMISGSAVTASEDMRFKQKMDFIDQYHSVEDIYKWLKEMQETHPEKIQIVDSGYESVEGRKILAVRVCSSPPCDNNKKRKKIYIQSLLHAREWIGGAALLTVISEMMKIPKSSSLNDFELIAVPVSNPDGYEFSRQNNENRLWRKNRRKNAGGSYGVDLNRNFAVPHSWGHGEGDGNSMEGSSNVEADEIYRGPKSFSEPETKAVKGFIESLGPFVLGVDVHSYGQTVLRPYGYQTPRDGMPEDETEQRRLGDAAARAMSQHYPIRYKSQHAGEGGFIGAGGCDDWMHDVGKMYSFTIELRDQGAKGFLLPESEIRPTGWELLKGLEAMASVLKSFDPYSSDFEDDEGYAPPSPPVLKRSDGGVASAMGVSDTVLSDTGGSGK